MSSHENLEQTVEWAIRELAGSSIVDPLALEVRRRLKAALRPSHEHDAMVGGWDPKNQHSHGDCRPECERRLDAHRDKIEDMLRRLADIESRGGESKPPEVELREDQTWVELRVNGDLQATFGSWQRAREEVDRLGLKVTRRTRMHRHPSSAGTDYNYIVNLGETVKLRETELGWQMQRLTDGLLLWSFPDKPAALGHAEKVGLTVEKVEPLEKQEKPAVPQPKCPDGWRVDEGYERHVGGLSLLSLGGLKHRSVWYEMHDGKCLGIRNCNTTEAEGELPLTFLAFEIMRRRSEPRKPPWIVSGAVPIFLQAKMVKLKVNGETVWSGPRPERLDLVQEIDDLEGA